MIRRASTRVKAHSRHEKTQLHYCPDGLIELGTTESRGGLPLDERHLGNHHNDSDCEQCCRKPLKAINRFIHCGVVFNSTDYSCNYIVSLFLSNA